MVEGERPRLIKLDRSLDLVVEADLADGEHHLRGESFVALEPAVGHRRADGFFDLAPTVLRNLRSDVLRTSSFILGAPLKG